MPLRTPAGFRSAFYDPLKVADAPTIGTATAGDAQASVTFTAPSNVGGAAITAYYGVSDPSALWGTSASSPVTVTGLSNGTSYTFRVWALNSYGPSPYSAATGSVSPAAARGLFGGGNTGTNSNIIDYITIPTTGNATDFGDLSAGSASDMACSSTTRGLFAPVGGATNVIEYVTIATTSNSTDFGDLLVTGQAGAGCSNSTRGIWGAMGGTNTINYSTIATTGNATDFGDLLNTPAYLGACASPTRGVYGGGGNLINVIQYVTIATTGNATDFGDLIYSVRRVSACSSSTRGLWMGGDITGGNKNTIQYITIATTGNALDFGDLTLPSQDYAASCSSETRGVVGGGEDTITPTAYLNVMAYVTIATTGNATDFGDLTVARRELAACSSGHGGLQ